MTTERQDSPESVAALADRLGNVVPDLEGDGPTIDAAAEALDRYAALRAADAPTPGEEGRDG